MSNNRDGQDIYLICESKVRNKNMVILKRIARD